MSESNGTPDQLITDLVCEHKEFLCEDYLPFIEKFVYDKVNGGFKWNTNYKGVNITQNKRTWYDGRGVWVYSYLYENFSKEERHLEIAEKTVSLLLKVKKEKESLWPWSYKADGTILNKRDSDLYGNLFVAEGFGMYAKASKKWAFWDKSKEIILRCVSLYDAAGYSYKLQYTPDKSLHEAKRVLGHWMVILRVCTGLLRIKSDKELEGIAERCVDALMNKHFDNTCNLMLEVLDENMNPIDGAMGQFVYIGHAIESLWMLMDEALRKEDSQLFHLAKKRFKHHVQVAWDDIYCGIYHCLDNVEENKWKLDKVLWAQHETLIGLLILIKEQDDPWAKSFYHKLYEYVILHFRQNNIKYHPWKIGGNRQMVGESRGTRIENYHHPRYLMLSIEMLESILNKIRS